MGEPLVRVSVNTAELDQMDELKRTLKLLTVLDPSLRILELETGELAMVTAGEVHLQKCLKDLEDMGMSGLEVRLFILIIYISFYRFHLQLYRSWKQWYLIQSPHPWKL